MKRMGQGKCVVAVVSEKYLKSENCMFEMLELYKAGQWRERVFPIVMTDAAIYKATGRAGYKAHWEAEFEELDRTLKGMRGEAQRNLQEDLNLCGEISRFVDGITAALKDMNALTPSQHEGSGFEDVIANVKARLGV